MAWAFSSLVRPAVAARNAWACWGKNLREQSASLFGQLREDHPAIVFRGPAHQQLLLFQLIDRVCNIAAGDQNFLADLLQRHWPFLVE
jgi:hypothetical protein